MRYIMLVMQLGIITIGCYLIWNNINAEKRDMVQAAMGLFVVVMGLYYIYTILSVKMLYFYDKHLEVYGLGRKLLYTIRYTDIEKITESTYSRRHITGYNLTIYFDGKMLDEISSEKYTNYGNLKEFIQNQVKQIEFIS